MSDWIFAAPLWVPTMLGLAGVVVFIEGNRRLNKLIRGAGIAIFLLAVLLITLGRVVDTDKKKVTRGTHALIEDVAAGKWDAVSALLEPDAVVTVAEGGTWITGADNIVTAAKDDTSTWPLSGTWIESLQLDQTGTEMTATMTLRSSFAAYPSMMVPSTWQLDWVKDADEWKVHEIRAMQIGDKTGPDMERDLPKK